jgi:hypothetical protein
VKRIKIRRRLREWKADSVRLQETKMEVINLSYASNDRFCRFYFQAGAYNMV